MKLRLVKEGSESLKEYLRPRFVLAQLAEDIGITNQSLHAILNGDRGKPKRVNLEMLAQKTDLTLGFDERGPFFETSARSSNIPTVTVELDAQLAQFYELIKNIKGARDVLNLLKDMPEDVRSKWIEIGKILFQAVPKQNT